MLFEDNIEGLVIFLIPNNNKKDFIFNLITLEGFYVLKKRIVKIEDILNSSSLINKFLELSKLDFKTEIFTLVAFDCFPLTLSESQKLLYPKLDNARLLIKHKTCYYPPNSLNAERIVPILYSTENSQDAYQFLKKFFLQEVCFVKNKISELNCLLSSIYPVKKQLSSDRQRRAKVELIDYKGTLAVKKTYRPGCDRFWEREIFVMEELSKIRSEIPPLLEQGTLYIIYPYYEDIFKFDPINNPKISLEIATQVMEILYFFYDLGYALIDFYPNNLIIDKKEGLKIIDFEFLYKYKNKPDSFLKCYDLAGIPEDFDGDRPVIGKKRGFTRSYQNDWQPYIGLGLHELLQKTQNK